MLLWKFGIIFLLFAAVVAMYFVYWFRWIYAFWFYFPFLIALHLAVTFPWRGFARMRCITEITMGISSVCLTYFSSLLYYGEDQMHEYVIEVFTLAYELSVFLFVILIPLFLNKKKELHLWKFILMSEILGVLFGPFALLFWRIFPERRDNQDVYWGIFGGFVYGNVMCTLLWGIFVRYYVYRKL